MLAYLVECIDANHESGDYLHSGFEAAWELAAWLKHLHRLDESAFINGAAARLETLFRDGSEDLRNRIETGALEHVFESPALRAHFARWEHDPALAGAYDRALAWGKAHEVAS